MTRKKLTAMMLSAFLVLTVSELAKGQEKRAAAKRGSQEKRVEKSKPRGEASPPSARTRPGHGSIHYGPRRPHEIRRYGPRGGGPVVIERPYWQKQRLVRLPHGHRVIHYHGRPYYYHRHVFYEPAYIGTEIVYVPIEPPDGLVLEVVPEDCITVAVGGNTFYYGGGVFYRRVVERDRVTVVVTRPPIGAVVPVVPVDHTVVVVGGRTYYQHGGLYYKRVFDRGQLAYMVVGSPE